MDVRGPGRYLWWLAGRCRARVALGALYGSLWFATLALTPYLIAQAVDRGLAPRDPAALISWVAAVALMGVATAVLGILRHRTMTKLRLQAAMITADRVMAHATRLGSALPRRVTAGEVVTIGISDVWTIGRAMSVVGMGVASTAAFLVIATLLSAMSMTLAVVVLVGVPALALIVGPLLGRTQRAGARYREGQGALTARLVDVLGGLRVLNGLGGKRTHLDRYRRESARVRELGYRVGRPASWIGALGDGLPLVFLGVVTWLAARRTAAGELSVGELIAVYGYTAMLVLPVNIAIFCGFDMAHGLVSARRVTEFLRLPADDRTGGAPPGGPAPLHDPESGVTAEPGRFTALAADHPADAIAVIDRLGGYGATDATWGGRRIDRIAQPAVRSRVLVAENDASIFAGPLREVVAGPDDPDDGRVRAAITTAVAADIAASLSRPVEWDGRNLSGGQRQRLRLARAVHADPEMLLAVEPTSAVDAHTESAVAQRLAAARAGRGTLVATTSPVLLARADVVYHLAAGRVAARGTHEELLAASAGYRDLVSRAFESGDSGSGRRA